MSKICLLVASAIALAFVIVLPTVDLYGQGSSSFVPEITPPEIGSSKTVKLPAGVDDVQVGGGGRYLLYQFNDLKKIGVFDVNVAKITHYISMPDASSKFAAGLDKVVLVNADGSVVSRYNLATGERELTGTIDLQGAPTVVLLGNASTGPAIVGEASSYRSKPYLVDLKTLKAEPLNVSGNSRGFGNAARISGNGKTIGHWSVGVSPSGFRAHLKIGDSWKAFSEHTSVGAIVPSADGKRLFTGRGIYTDRLKQVGASGKQNRDSPTRASIPAVHGNLYLSIATPARHRRGEEKESEKVTLHMAGESRDLAEVSGLVPISKERGQPGETLTMDKRLIFIPKANLIAQLNGTNDAVVLTSFDAEAAMEKSDVDFLFVVSAPPIEVKAGSSLKYDIRSKSNVGGVKYSLDAAPVGMKLSNSGTLTWSPTTASAPENSVIVTVSDSSGQEIFHTFNLKVDGGRGKVGQAPSSDAVFSTEVAGKAIEASIDEDRKTIQLPASVDSMVVGGGGRYVLLHFKDLKKVGLFDVGKAKIVKYFPAMDDQSLVTAGANHCLIFGQDQGVVSRFNLTTFERELTKTIPFNGSVQYVGMGSNSFGPVMVRWSNGTGQIDRASFGLMDLETLNESKKYKWDRQPHAVRRDGNVIRATSDGKIFTIGGVGAVALRGGTVQTIGSGSRGRGMMIPSSTGKYFVSGSQILNSKLVPLDPNQRNQYGNSIVPAVSGQYYLSFTQGDFGGFPQPNGNKKAGAKVFMFGDTRPIVTVPNLALPTPTQSFGRLMQADSRCMFIPDAKVIVSASDTGDSLELRRMDIEEALKASGVDYLIVVSTAPATAKLGQRYAYQLDVKSKKGGVKFKLDSGPKGMAIGTDGSITWTPQKDLDDVEQKVIVTVSDSAGQEMFHTFDIAIPEVAEMVAAKKTAAEEKRRLAGMEQERARILKMTEASAARRQALKEQLQAKIANGSSGRKAPVSSVRDAQYPVRDWVDSTGQHRINARFLRVDKKSTVILVGTDGKERPVPLAKLSSQDIYRAVKNDLMKSGEMGAGAKVGSNPFNRSSDKSSSRYVTDPAVLASVIDSVEKHITSLKSDADPMDIVSQIGHPEMLGKMQERPDWEERFTKEFKSKTALEILKAMSGLDFKKAQLMGDVISFDSSRPRVRLKKDGKIWKLLN